MKSFFLWTVACLLMFPLLGNMATAAAYQDSAVANLQETQETLEATWRTIPGLEPLVEEFSALRILRAGPQGAPQLLRTARQELEETNALLEELDTRFSGTQRRMDAAGLSEGMGGILRRDAQWLPSPEGQKNKKKRLQSELSAAQILLIELEEKRAASPATGRKAQELLVFLGVETPVASEIIAVEDLLDRYSAVFGAKFTDLKDLQIILSDTLSQSDAIDVLAAQYREFIEKKVLWVRSSSLSAVPLITGIGSHFAEALHVATSWSLAASWKLSAWSQRLQWILALVFASAVLLRRSALYALREKWNLATRRHRSDQFRKTLAVLGLTGMLAAPLPLLLWITGSLMKATAIGTGADIGERLLATAAVWLVFRFLVRAFEEDGLIPIHFHWPSEGSRQLLPGVRWLEPIALLGTLIAFPTGSSPWDETLGRLGIVTTMVALSVFSFRAFRIITTPVEQNETPATPASSQALLVRALPLWNGLAVLVPMGLGLAALFGFVFTAEQIGTRLVNTILFALGLLLMQGLLIRWLAVARRRLAVAQAMETRAAREAAKLAEAGDGLLEVPTLDLDHLHIPSLDAQTRQLFRSGLTLATVLGLFFLWRSVFPALGDLNRFEVWPNFGHVVEVQDSIPVAEHNVAAETPQVAQGLGPGWPMTEALSPRVEAETVVNRLTLGEILLALIFFMVTLLFARNLPALLELTILQRLPLDSGTRYAASTLVRYFVLLVGLGAISSALGISWQQVQWLAAALTFGLAFGLQEIFANFVSGLIILFERPVRVGDIVTVGDTEGKVTALRMRSTTIQDWNRRELLVPNKEFITQRVVNWTLSDPVTRIIVPVGIAYGSDTNQARLVLLQCAEQEPLALKNPAPQALFLKFGESSLDFQLRVFIGNPENMPTLVDQLHQRIDTAFRNLGIAIAFPQRDVHIHSVADKRQPTDS